jgi:hypothetical protein
MKLLFKLVGVSFLMTIKAYSQEKINFGSQTKTLEIVDKNSFNIYDTWRVIHREYITEMENTHESILLNSKMKDDMLELYKFKKLQGELIYGNYVKFERKSYQPFCPYLHNIVVEPRYEKKEVSYDFGKNGIFPKLRGKKVLNIEVWCPFRKQIEEDSPNFTVTVLSQNLIIIPTDNTYTILERLEKLSNKRKEWETDELGFNMVKLKGHGEFQFFINKDSVNSDKSILFFLKSKRDKKNYIQISKFLKDNTLCSMQWKEEFILRIKDSLTTLIHYPFKSFKEYNNIVWVSGNTLSQNDEWEVRWKIMDKVNEIKTIIVQKSTIHSFPDRVTTMYLLKNDKVEVLDKQNDFIKIRYYGKKIIEGWIKQSDTN